MNSSPDAHPVPLGPLLARTGAPALALVGGAYALLVAGSLAAVFLLGAWGIPLLAVAGLAVFLAVKPLRAAFTYFAIVPFLLGFPEAGTPTTFALSLVAPAILFAAWLKELVGEPSRVRVPASHLVPVCVLLVFTVLSFAYGNWRRDFPEASPIAVNAVWQACLAMLPSILLIPAVRKREDLRALAWVVVLAAIFPTLSVLFIDTRTTADLEGGRYAGLFANGFHDAALFELSYFFIAAALWIVEKPMLRKLLLVGVAAMFVLAMILAGSRTSLAAMAVAGAVSLVAAPRTFWQRVRVPTVYLVVCILLGGLFLASIRVSLSAGAVGITYSARAELVRRGLNLFFDDPLTGVGIGVHQYYFSNVVLPGFQVSPMIHTYYVTILAENGVFGFLAFMWIVGATIHHYVRSIARFHAQGDFEAYVLTWAFFFSFMAVLTVLTTQAGVGNRLFWLLVGVALCIRGVLERQREPLAPRRAPLPPPVSAV